MVIGCSDITIDKQRDLRNILAVEYIIIKNILKKTSRWACHIPYFIDTTCGSGSYSYSDEEINIIGSPLVFLDLMSVRKFRDLKYKAIFIDKDKKNINILKNRLQTGFNINNDSIKLIHGKNENVMNEVLDSIPLNAFGVVYNDMNGIPGFEMMEKISTSTKLNMIDILIRCNCTSIKRATGALGYDTLKERLSKINKRKWLIKKPNDNDRWQWIFLFGFNKFNPPQWKKEGWYYLDSTEGKDIFEKVNCTKRQMELID